METAYCLSLTLLLAAPLVTATDEEVDIYDSSYSYSAESEFEEVEEGVVLPSAPKPGTTEVKDILDDNYHMFRRKRQEDADDQVNNVPVFYSFENNKVLQHHRDKDDLRIRSFLKTF